MLLGYKVDGLVVQVWCLVVWQYNFLMVGDEVPILQPVQLLLSISALK